MKVKKNRLSADEVKALSSLLETNLHAFSPFHEYEAMVGKKRLLYRPTPEDTWVIHALAAILRVRAKPQTSSSVYSYIPGRGPHLALKHLARKIRASRNGPLYILRRDVSNYTDSIPTEQGSPLWQILEPLFPESNLRVNLKNSLCPQIISRSNPTPHRNPIGIPMGLANTPWIANLYLKPIDDWATGLSPDDLYLRYGDDILFLTESTERALIFQREFSARLQKIGLTSKSEKERALILTRNGVLNPGDGKPSDDFKPCSSFEYLGRRVLASGHLGITGEKRSLYLREVRYRIRNVLKSNEYKPASLTPEKISDTLGKELFGTLQDIWENHWKSENKYTSLRHEINHPGEWRSLRIDTLRETLKLIQGNTHFYALRKMSWAKLIHSWGWAPIGLSISPKGQSADD